MANELKSDKEENVRQNVVDTAVSFLRNPDVIQRSDDTKIAFLQKKGLTDLEIAQAFNRVKYDDKTALVASDDQQLVNAYPLPPYQTSNSVWFHLRNYGSTFVTFAVTAYILQCFYKSYIEPWLFGSKSQESELSDLKQHLIELNHSVSRLTSTVASLEETVNNQMCQIGPSSLHDVESVPKSVRDILDEVSDVKGLLLNRFSFPAPPTVGGAITDNKMQNEDSKASMKVVTIPKWQLRDSTKEQFEESENKASSCNNTSTPSTSTSLENSSCFSENEENNVMISKDKLQEKDSNATSQDEKVSLENGLSTNKDKDSEIFVQNEGREITMDEDSGIESHNCLSDFESTYQSGNNEHH